MDTLFPLDAPAEAKPAAPPVRLLCEVSTVGDRDEIIPCRTMEWMLRADKHAFRMTSHILNLRSRDHEETRDAVVIDLVDNRKHQVWSECLWCPFCGARIATTFRPKKPAAGGA